MKKESYVLITGANTGIGYELAKIYAENNYKLIVVSRRTDNLEKLKEKYKDIVIISKDLSKIENVYELYQETKKMNLKVDILVNNAGVGLFGDFISTNLEQEINMINLNITAVIVLTKLYLEDMVKENKGEIINISSIASFVPGPKMSVYYATKAFITSFSKAISYELKNTNIKVKIIAPGATATNFEKAASLESSSLFDNMKVMSAEEVAKSIYKSKKLMTIPGLLNKMTVFFSKFTPTKLLLYVIDKIQNSKK